MSEEVFHPTNFDTHTEYFTAGPLHEDLINRKKTGKR